MEGYQKTYCRAVKQITGKDYECHALRSSDPEAPLPQTFPCPFGNCIEDIFEEAGKEYSAKVMKELAKALKEYERWERSGR